MNRKEMLYEVQKCGFAAYDMLLYLDTHPNDRRAFRMFKEVVEKYNRLKAKFEREHGPLDAFSGADFSTFKWLEEPWPWQKEANL